MKVASTLFAILISAGLSFGQGMPAEATPDVAKSVNSYTADATVQANAGNQSVATYGHESLSKKAATEGTTTVNNRVKAAAARADGDYTVADPQPAMEKSRKNDKKKAKQAKIR